MRRPTAWLALLCTALSPTVGLARPGDLGEPLVIPGFPFVHAASTVGRKAVIDRYACAAHLSEVGPEVVYRTEVPKSGTLTAWVDGDTAQVDIDVHLLSSLSLDASRTATACLDRGNRWAQALVQAGTYFVVVDSYESFARAGPYRLRVDFAPVDEWYIRQVARGVTLRTRVYPDLYGARQTTSVLEVDLADSEVRIRPVGGGACTRTSVLARTAGAVAAVNGGFFDSSCASVSLLKIDGVLLARNAVIRTAFGLTPNETPLFKLVAAGADWPEVAQALGGLPRIVTAGAVDVRTVEEGSSTAFETTRHPRTAVGVTGAGAVLLATVDGRTSAGAGMSLPELAQWMIGIGARDALNLDGGGSTTLWVESEPFDGIVNYPSDNGQADRLGERAVSNALAVFAPRLDRDALWLTTPPPGPVAEGALWSYEAVAADPEGALIRFFVDRSSVSGPVWLDDRGDGTARLSVMPSREDAANGEIRLRLEAAVSGSRSVFQTIQLTVTPASDAGGGPDAGPPPFDGGPDAGLTPDGGSPLEDGGGTLDGGPRPEDGGLADAGASEGDGGFRPPASGGGCGCRAAPRAAWSSGLFWFGALLFPLAVAHGHRRRAP
jgi:hypothetical protein